MGDVAVLEAATEVLVNELAKSVVPDGEGTYVPARLDVPPADPFVHAVQPLLEDAGILGGAGESGPPKGDSGRESS